MVRSLDTFFVNVQGLSNSAVVLVTNQYNKGISSKRGSTQTLVLCLIFGVISRIEVHILKHRRKFGEVLGLHHIY